jgi:hypothetical protein
MSSFHEATVSLTKGKGLKLSLLFGKRKDRALGSRTIGCWNKHADRRVDLNRPPTRIRAIGVELRSVRHGAHFSLVKNPTSAI